MEKSRHEERLAESSDQDGFIERQTEGHLGRNLLDIKQSNKVWVRLFKG